MQFDNNTTRIRRSIFVRLARLCFEGKVIESIDRLPIDMRPRTGGHDRCCVHKERAVIKYRLMAMMGYAAEDEKDEFTPLSDYAKRALNRDEPEKCGLTVIDEACSSCIRSSYFVTNACRGCYARPCTLNCPKKCISFVDGRAAIEADKCVNCGRCMKVCPYHAIVNVPIPCEEECPVDAISRDDSGREIIDESKCIHCGRCVSACPFGAIMDKSQIVDVIQNLLSPRPVVALVAPAIVGQFDAPLENIIGALKKLGFDQVMEVALGADITASREYSEIIERLGNQEPFMTTSCCPAYLEVVKKHIPEMRPFVSDTRTPMHYTAELALKQYPDAVTVFIGPCIAKRMEAESDQLVNYALTFEELGSMFVAKGIDVEDAQPESADKAATASGRGFPITGGVASAVMDMAKCSTEPGEELRPELLNGLNKQNLRLLKGYAAKGGDFNMLEVMCCEGGCVAGPCTIGSPKTATKKVHDLKKISDMCPSK